MNLSPAKEGIPFLNESLCLVCDPCHARQACRVKAIRIIDPGEAPFIDGHRCMACLDCIPECIGGAISRPVVMVQKT